MSVERRGLKMPPPRFASGLVKAGVLESATYPADEIKNAKTGETYPDPRAGMHVATIAAALEYGHGQNHPRPFMQQTFETQKRAWTKAVVTLFKGGMDGEHVLMTVGQVMKEDIQQTITDWPADNAPSWAEVKGFNKGLIMTSHLLKSIESEVVEGDE